ncbi:16862_t:CDS:1 [Funneliformis geosporum]|uniref:16227_t:CDS:1 n=1 Tax=Funneliformis geosporum TaxID=1117311 RepID=A0A9W4SJF4_9GLOM|nr:16227_t:CDS:1 [Funneliformis geosporum]CAI2169686.1 16862_t:CDS:1 [Funneliformis geosporum]
MGNNTSTLEQPLRRQSLKSLRGSLRYSKRTSLNRKNRESQNIINSQSQQRFNIQKDFVHEPVIQQTKPSLNVNPRILLNKIDFLDENSYFDGIHGWDSSATLSNNNTFSTGSTFTLAPSDERTSSPSTSSLETDSIQSEHGVIGNITETPIVEEPDCFIDNNNHYGQTMNTPHSSLFFREHDNSSEETATLNPSLFNSDEFYTLPEIHVISLLQRDDIEMAEIEIWNQLITWGVKNTLPTSTKRLSRWDEEDYEALREKLKNCVSWIRFFQIKPQEFAEFVWPYKQILPKSIIGNFLRQQITGHPPIIETRQNPPRIPSVDIDSTIITGRHASILASWMQQDEPVIGGKSPFNFCLLYRASRDGFSFKEFHELCDGQGPTVLVIKLVNSKQIIGAFNPLSYQKSRTSLLRKNKLKRMSTDSAYYGKDYSSEKEAKKGSFLFSFQTRYYPEETAVISRIIPDCLNDAIKHSRDGPCFGLGPDLLINLNEGEKIGKVYPASYQYPIINFEGNFEYEDVEVFSVMKMEQ